MAKQKEQSEVILNSDVIIVITKEWQHPFGTLKPIGTEITVTKELGEAIVGEGYAEIKTI